MMINGIRIMYLQTDSGAGEKLRGGRARGSSDPGSASQYCVPTSALLPMVPVGKNADRDAIP